jgi:DHA2 family multidrug resistance protein
MSAAALQPTAAPPAPAAAAAPPKRAIAGLVGILIAAMMAGLNNRVGALALADVRGALGFGLDDASWLTTVYSAGEVIAMPFLGMVRHHALGAPLRAVDDRRMHFAGGVHPLHP